MNYLLQDEKNIDSIFFYAINNDLNYLGFHYTANKKKYKKDYKDVDFKESVARLIKVYNILKDKNKINLIGDLTKNIIEGNINIALNRIYNKTILNKNKYDYLSMLDYIKLIVKHTLNALEIDHNDKFLSNISNGKALHYSANGIESIPLSFYKCDDGYKLKFRIFKDNIDYLFDCDIKMFNKSIIIKINNIEYKGEIIFDRLNIDNSINFEKDNKNIYCKYYDNTLTDEDKEKINKVFSLLDLNYEIDGIKTIDNNYILYNSNDDYEYYIKLNIQYDLIRVTLKHSCKFNKNNVSFKPTEENYDILITKYNDEYLLIQQKYLLSLNASNEFKQNINKSRYYLVKIDKDFTKKILDSNILKKEEINVEINDLEDINKLILKKDNNYGK